MAARRRVPQWVLVALACGAVALAVVNTVEAATAGNPNAEFSARIGPLSRTVLRDVPRGEGVVEIRSMGDETFAVGTGAGIANELERHGVSVRVSPSLAYVYGHYRQLDHERVRLVVLVSRRREPPPGYRPVGEGVGAGVFIKAP